jgi:CRP-like cAMP-binding protein
MARKPQVDVRKLKDEVADCLKKSKLDKAAEVLEQLIAAEPKDMSHRLKLGDTYRRSGDAPRAVGAYQFAAKFFADEGQLIKAIAAVKIVLEIDPRNADAQRQLGEMNERRMGKVTLESAGLKSRPGAAPAAFAIEPAPARSGTVQQPAVALDEDEDAPLELDDRPSAGRTAPSHAEAPPSSSLEFGGELELDIRTAPIRTPAPPPAKSVIAPPPPARREIELDLDPVVPPESAEQLPDEAILTPQAEDLVASVHDEQLVGLYENTYAMPVMPAEAQPIADLLADGREEDVEILTAEDEILEPAEVQAEPEEEDLDAAFDRVAPAGQAAKKVPVKKVPLFDDLSQDAFVELVNKLGYHRHAAGQLIIREGDPGRSFFIIVEGKVRIFKQGADGGELTLAHLGEGAFFGEMALLSGAPRTANVAAEEDTEILEVTDVVLRQLATKYPQVISSLKNFYRLRLLNNVMAISPLFKDFDPGERKLIVEKFRMKQAAPGEVLIGEGLISDGLYVVMHGSVQVSARKDRRDIELARLREGEIFGEMSLLTRQPASATVTSNGNSILLRLPRASFQELVVTHPQILELVSELTERRKSATEAILHGQGEGHDGMSFV